MLAKNPKTGANIRIMKSDASIWKNRKTLVWKKEAPSSAADVMKWSRWDIVIHGLDLIAWNPDIVVLTDYSPAIHAWLKTKAAKAVRFILISSNIVNTIGNSFQTVDLGNVLCLEELSSMYPFLGSTWNGTFEDAIVCAAIIFRYTRLIGIDDHLRLRTTQINNLVLSLEESSSPPEPLVLIQQYYTPPQSKRAKELYKCLSKNLECPFIDTIILCMESPNAKLPPDPNGKLVLITMKQRITYKSCIELVKSHVGPGRLVVFANTDIYLDATWRSIWSTDIHDVCVALLRWDEAVSESDSEAGKPTLFGPRSDSQDTWAFHSDSILSRTWDLNAVNIPFGKSGCDNAILVEFLRQKFKIVNPAMSLRTIHVHQSDIRTYERTDLVDRPVYMYVDPNGIHELNPQLTWDGWANTLVQHEALERPLKATSSKMLNMFCSQMNRDPSFVWSPDGINSYIPPKGQDRIIDVSGGTFVSPNGLVYKHVDLFIGSTEIQKQIWSDNTLSHLMPAQLTDSMMAFPLNPEWFNNPTLYTLYYLSNVVRQHRETPEASFWCKQTNELLSVFKLFKWNTTRGHLLEYSDQTQAFAGRVTGRTSHTIRSMPNDIDALRTALFNPWKSEPSGNSYIVIVTDLLHIKDGLLTDILEASVNAGYTVRVISSTDNACTWDETLSGASRVILSTSAKNFKTTTWAWMWMAPKGCKILELQEEREPSDALLHLCATAKQEWTLLQYPRSTPEGFKKIVGAEVNKWFSAAVTSALPLVIVPPKTLKFGFFGHKGDSFREMVELWAEKGYVERREDSAVTQCWLNGVGKVLLYDRPTWDWLEKVSDSEQSYKLCLAGNPDPSKPTTKPWTFWPRQPRLVERLAATLTPLEDRKDSIVFFGRIENDIQGKYRQDVSGWQSMCSKFSMPVGAKEPYVLGPEEYLVALKNSKYGLCLRGFGPKCNREIELLAMGTVPLVTPGVDITNYAEPLIDGIHVLCVSSPEDAKRTIAAIPDSQWETMSKAGHMWWKRNASAEGSWSRTQSQALLPPL